MSDEHGTRVGPVMLYSAKTDAVVDFYRALVGLSGEAGESGVWLDGANAQVVVNRPSAQDTPPEIRAHAGFVVWFGVGDVKAAHDKAKRAGCVVGDFYGDYFFVRDPDGRFVGIYSSEDHQHDHEH